MYSTIIHATDLKENHYEMCAFSKKFAEQFSAKLYLMHVIQPPASLQLAQGLGFAEFDKPLREDALAVLKVIADGLDLSEDQLIVEIGSVKTHILKKIEELSCDLIIIGKRSTDIFPHLLGSTANAITHHAPCHVLTINS